MVTSFNHALSQPRSCDNLVRGHWYFKACNANACILRINQHLPLPSNSRLNMWGSNGPKFHQPSTPRYKEYNVRRIHTLWFESIACMLLPMQDNPQSEDSRRSPWYTNTCFSCFRFCTIVGIPNYCHSTAVLQRQLFINKLAWKTQLVIGNGFVIRLWFRSSQFIWWHVWVISVHVALVKSWDCGLL